MGSNDVDTGSNLSYTKFLFITPVEDDEATRTRIRAAGNVVVRGFANDFDADGSREPHTKETIQFLRSDLPSLRGNQAPFVVQISSRYRPRLDEVEFDLRRRIGGQVEISALDGALRHPRYSSAEMNNFALGSAAQRRPGRQSRHAIIIPLRKKDQWWNKEVLDRHWYFYPHIDPVSGSRVLGHVCTAAPGIPVVYRSLYHNPDGYQRPGENDFVCYFEVADEHLATFDMVRRALRSAESNPEWQFVIEGSEWRGTRVLRW